MTTPHGAKAFLKNAAWENASYTPLAGDASARRYMRLSQGDNTAILMIAPPNTCGSLTPFLNIAKHLKTQGLRAPEIFATDQTNGFMLLEDFGDHLLATLADRSPDKAIGLYEQATDVLIKLHGAPWPPDMAPTSNETLVEMIQLVFDHYAPSTAPGDQSKAKHALASHLQALPHLPHSLSLRDYHAENIVWLGDHAEGTDAMGLLDFQDAFVTHPSYDLVSLCQDVRRDVSPEIEQACIARFLSGTGLDEHAFLAGYYAIGLQRNLRILGVFCRLATQRKKPQYRALLPRVWQHLQNTLERPEMADLKQAFACLPPPQER